MGGNATFAAIVACQIGTALAARTERESLRRVGLTSNRMLLFEVVFAASLIYLPAANDVMHTAPLPPEVVLLLCVFPVVVWGADECYRAWLRRRLSRTVTDPTPAREGARG